MRDLIYICAQTTEEYFTWQVGMWLQSLQDIGEDSKAHVLLYHDSKSGLPVSEQWEKLSKLYPAATFKIYKDGNMKNLLRIYVPLIRPFVLTKYFNENPHLSEKAVFYCDSDIIFTKKPELDNYLNDDVTYLSNTVSYIGSNYIINKVKDVLPRQLKAFEKRDVLGEMCSFVGIKKDVAIQNELGSGGAQYLLKNVTGKFWEKVMTDCVVIKVHLDNVNRDFFESTDKGYQSWCADMWAVLYNVWLLGMETKVVPEMDFAWATDLIIRLDKVSILHNAGVTGDSIIRTAHKDENGKSYMIDAPAFYKGKFVSGSNPYNSMDYLNKVVSHPKTKEFCTHYYANYLLSIKDKLSKIY